MVITGDVRDVMPRFDDDTFQTVITSPPYWQNGYDDYRIGLEKTKEEYIAGLVDIFTGMRRIIKPTGTVWLNLGNEVGVPWEVAFALRNSGWILVQDIILHTAISSNPHEYLFLFAKTHTYEYEGVNSTVWRMRTEIERMTGMAEFCAFSLDMVRRCLKATTIIDDKVLDPFCGSGSTGVVAKEMNREFYGIEMNPLYAALADAVSKNPFYTQSE